MDAWLCWAYQYGVGGLAFASSIFLLVKSKALSLNRKQDKRLLFAIIAGFLAFMTVHAVWIWLATSS